ncbi:MAG: hypothetical protein IPJ84_09545 [Bdellovibrionales bacterium]|nr:hypothetical protein [Bdellovibrionales bacterium]
MMQVLVCLLVATTIFASSDSFAEGREKTIDRFESVRRRPANRATDEIYRLDLAEKYYLLLKPDVSALAAYYQKSRGVLPSRIQHRIDRRLELISRLAHEPKRDGVTLAKRVLEIGSRRGGDTDVYEGLALGYVEMAFAAAGDEGMSEAHWLMRIDLRRRVSPEYEIVVLPSYLRRYPKGSGAKEWARYLQGYLRDDYRPDTGNADIPKFDLDDLKLLIDQILTSPPR